MLSELLQSVLSNVWYIFLVIVFFGGSILVHELGHFWAARRRGVHVERFSIGFGPKIFAWHGKDGVEYRVSWLPLGGYVALPQLADMSALEGPAAERVAALPPPSYATKMIVFVAGATMNIVFAFLLACIVWIVGMPVSNEMSGTRIGYVTRTLTLADGTQVPSPAAKAGLEPGDIVRAIDGTNVADWIDLKQTLLTSSGRGADGQPKSVFTIDRNGRLMKVTVYPQLTGFEHDRSVGILPGYDLIVHSIDPGSPAAKAGVHPGDVILSIDGTRILQIVTYQEVINAHAKSPVTLVVRRGAADVSLVLPPAADPKVGHGMSFTAGYHVSHPSPFSQIWDQFRSTFQVLGSIISPHSDVGLSNMAGPVGIIRIFHTAAEAGFIPVVLFTILVNVSLAVFNLLPIPVLDGGHMLLATIGKLRGRPIAPEFIATTQSVFMILLLGMILYVSFFDVRRIRRDDQTAPAPRPAPSAPAAAPAK